MDKKNIPVTIALSIPLLMIVLVIAVIYIPRVFATAPKYSFIYSTGNYNSMKISVLDGQLTVQNTIPPKPSDWHDPLLLFIYDIKNESTREISIEEASKFVLDGNMKSPDGYTIEKDSSSDLISDIFGYHNRNAWYLTGHGTGRKINLPDHINRWTFRFIGWVIQ